jgi:transposase InsO family protein
MVEYLKAENRILRHKLPKRIDVTPAERATLMKFGVRLWATDFFTKTVWTLRGPVTYHVLFFIHLYTRRVHVAGMTPNPDGVWMAQIARNMSMTLADEPAEFRPTHIVRDRDSKFTAEFCSILETDDIQFRPIPARSPNLNPFAEAWVQRTKHEVLNHFIVFGEHHLQHILACWLTYYHQFRPHQGLGNVPILTAT